MFIVFEGMDKSGKTTQANMLFDYMKRQSYLSGPTSGKNVLMVREPGSTLIGEQVRDILLDIRNDDMDPMTEMLLFNAAPGPVREPGPAANTAGRQYACHLRQVLRKHCCLSILRSSVESSVGIRYMQLCRQ